MLQNVLCVKRTLVGAAGGALSIQHNVPQFIQAPSAVLNDPCTPRSAGRRKASNTLNHRPRSIFNLKEMIETKQTPCQRRYITIPHTPPHPLLFPFTPIWNTMNSAIFLFIPNHPHPKEGLLIMPFSINIGTISGHHDWCRRCVH